MNTWAVYGTVNSHNIINTVDGYAISINRGADVLKYIAINKYDEINSIHRRIEEISKDIHDEMRKNIRKSKCCTARKRVWWENS